MAAYRATRAPGLTGRGAAACGMAIVALVLLQLWQAAGPIRQYRVTLLGMRYAVASPEAGVLGDTLRVGSNYASVDLYVDVPGKGDVAELRTVGDTVPAAVLVSQAEDAQAVVAIQDGDDATRLRIVGGGRLRQGDVVRVSGAASARLTFARSRGRLAWRQVHRIVADDGRSVVLPPARVSWRDSIFERRLGPFQRTYPLADVLEALEPGTPVGELSSFFYYQDGELSFADLDSEVIVSGRAAPAVDTVWAAGAGERRLVLAGLTFRDHRELGLTAPERYGLRTLRAGRVQVQGPWLNFYLSAPEIRSFGRNDLEQLSLDARTRRAPCSGREQVFRVHLSPVHESLTRRAITFSAPPRRFESASQAVLSLPCAFAPGALRVLTPSGTIAGKTGAPFSLGDGRREVLVRVDAKRLTLAGRLLVGGLLLLPVLLLPGLAVPSVVRGIAVCALGLMALRLLLGLSAGVEYPYLQEAGQTGLWLAPVLPWAILAVGARGASRGGRDAALHLTYAVAMSAAAWVLFVDSSGKRLVLGMLPLLVFLVAHEDLVRAGIGRLCSVRPPLAQRAVTVAREAWRGAGSAATALARLFPARLRAWSARWPGASFAAGLFLLRFVFALAGNTESFTVAGSRVGISVFYTPFSLLLLVEVVRSHERTLRETPQRSPAKAVLDIWIYLAVAFAAVALLVADLGLALTTLPAAMLFLLLAGDRLASPTPRGAGIRVALAMPLVLFALIQLQPRLALPAGDPSQPHFRMQKWETGDLRLLEFGDPASLQRIGQRRSEALGAMSETMRAYTGGPWAGAGYFRSEVSPELRATAAQEHVVSALVAGQWGIAGTLGLVLILCALLAPAAAWWRSVAPTGVAPWRSAGTAAVLLLLVLLALSAVLPLSGGWRLLAVAVVVVFPILLALAWAHWAELAPEEAGSVPPLGRAPTTAGLFLLTLACAGLYMVLANYGAVLFTGKNVYGLGLDSIGDILESLVLFVGAALWLPREVSPPPAARR